MFDHSRLFAVSVFLFTAASSAAWAQSASPPPANSGVVRAPSVYSVDETIDRLKDDIAVKGITYFTTIDQSDPAAGVDIELRPSKLLIFGNPPLGVQFLTASPYAGLDWPVRMLVFEDGSGQVWVAYTDFAFIGERYALEDRDAQLNMATGVAASIAASVAP